MRLTITLPDYVGKWLEEESKRFGITRSGYIAMAITHKREYDRAVVELPGVLRGLENLREVMDKEKANSSRE